MLNTNDNLGNLRDDLYRELLDLHAGLDSKASSALNARLILILLNHIGDPETIRDAYKAAIFTQHRAD